MKAKSPSQSATANRSDTFCAYVALAGVTNAGKSSLLNVLAGRKVSITSPKPQTTRNVVYGIFIQDKHQVILVDTPGAFNSKNVTMKSFIRQQMFQGLYQGQIILLVIDAVQPHLEYTKEIMQLVARDNLQLIVALNKTDLLRRKDKLFALTERLVKLGEECGVTVDNLIPISAQKKDNIDLLRTELLKILPSAPFVYDSAKELNEPKFMACELLREQIFRQLHQEIPFRVNIVCESMKDEASKPTEVTPKPTEVTPKPTEATPKPTKATPKSAAAPKHKEHKPAKRVKFINLTVLVPRESHKGIILGAQGKKMKEIASKARLEMEKLFAGPVMLSVRIKLVKDNAQALAQSQARPN